MPSRPPRPCRRCYKLQVGGSPFCADHQQPVGWQAHQRGLTSTQRGYGADWNRIRDRVRDEEPYCRLCAERGLTVATYSVDHIIPKSRGGTDDRGNLRGLCGDCHRRKTGRDRLHPYLNGSRDRVSTPRQTTREVGTFERPISGSSGDFKEVGE